MLDKDIDTVDTMVHWSITSTAANEAWQRIKKELSELAQLSHNTGSPKLPTSCIDCPLSLICGQPVVINDESCQYCRRQLRAGA